MAVHSYGVGLPGPGSSQQRRATAHRRPHRPDPGVADDNGAERLRRGVASSPPSLPSWPSSGCGGDDGGDAEVSTDGGVTESPPRTTVTTRPDGEPVTVAEAADLPDGTEVTVRAYVFEPDEGATVMCDLLGESFPPTCVGPQLVTNGLDINSLPGVETTAPGDFVAPATWTPAPSRSPAPSPTAPSRSIRSPGHASSPSRRKVLT